MSRVVRCDRCKQPIYGKRVTVRCALKDCACNNTFPLHPRCWELFAPDSGFAVVEPRPPVRDRKKARKR